MRVLLDENVSPRIVPSLRQDGHDALHIRDLGLIGRPDHLLWRRAIEDGRVFVTINARDFARLAEKAELHGGLLTFPSGARPDTQLELTRLGLMHLATVGNINRWARVNEDRSVDLVELPVLR